MKSVSSIGSGAITSSGSIQGTSLTDGTATATVGGGTLPYDYSWSNGQTTLGTIANTNSISNLAAGLISITITDGNGCNSSANETILEPTAVSASLGVPTMVTCNGDANGSFVYLGFKPALVVIRAAQADSNGAESWFAYDTARDTSNPITEPLSWNNQSQEGATVRDLDILSNGFKLRSAANQTNGNGTNYIYAAWAEHPSGGGENVPPATAR